MMRGFSHALKKIVRGGRNAGAQSRFVPGLRREAERTADGAQSLFRTFPDGGRSNTVRPIGCMRAARRDGTDAKNPNKIMIFKTSRHRSCFLTDSCAAFAERGRGGTPAHSRRTVFRALSPETPHAISHAFSGDAAHRSTFRTPARRLICVMLGILLLLSPAALTSCVGSSGEKAALTVVCTNFPCYDFARQLCRGTDAEIVMLLPPGGESHSYDPTPKDIAAIARADVFVYVGGESDEWANGVIASADNEELRIFRLTEAVKLREEEIPEGADEDHDHGAEGDASAHGDGADSDDGHNGGEYDEHVWTSPVNVISICAALRGVLAESAPELADTFASNESEYRTELEKLDASFREVVGNGARRTVVFGDRFPLLYFVKEYGLDYYAAFPGCSSAVEASPAAVAFLIGKVKEENIPAVFHIELSKTEICEAIAEETGAKVLQFNACHNLTAEQFAAGATYVSLMTENVSALAIALG